MFSPDSSIARVEPSIVRRFNPRAMTTPQARPPLSPPAPSVPCYNESTIGGVAQLVRARGSYPRSRGFEALRRHHPSPWNLMLPHLLLTRSEAAAWGLTLNRGSRIGLQGPPCASPNPGL